MSDFNVPPKMSDIVRLTQEESDACDRAYGPFDQQAADAAREASVREHEARNGANGAKLQIIIPLRKPRRTRRHRSGRL